MDTSKPIRAVFVTGKGCLYSSPPGGVQNCTREFIATLKAAGFSLTMVEYDTDRRPLTRLRRRFGANPYRYRVPPTVVTELVQKQKQTGSQFVFLNGIELADIAAAAKKELVGSGVKLILHSFGLKSIDYLHNSRVAGTSSRASTAFNLGRLLLEEAAQRRYIDHVLCLASFEATFEQWLGAKRVDWIPRTVPKDPPLDWAPGGNRIGCVCTLHHGPNIEGLLEFLTELERIVPEGVRFRLVGQPASEGKNIVGQFGFVDYLGHLDDAALREEAASWNCFAHPLFCYAAGASTKLATALSWQIPIVATTVGTRGYRWREGRIPIADDPPGFAALTLDMLQNNTALSARDEIRKVAQSCPTIEEVGALIRKTIATPSA